MRKYQLLIAMAVTALMIVAGAAYADVDPGTSCWLSTDAIGTPIIDNTITVATNGTVKLYCFLNSDKVGNTFEAMVGYDTSDASTYGVGKSTNHGASKKLTLISSKEEIQASMDAARFGVLASALLDASGSELSNPSLSGRPYGFVGRLATRNNAAPGNVQCFSFTIKNNMAVGELQYVVLSNIVRGNSYSTAWKHGTSLAENSYALKIVSGPAVALPTVGASNKTASSALMSTVASKYNWVFWGKVSARDNNGFVIDDGSGVLIKVVASGNTVADGNYVSVKGSINLSTTPYPTLTSESVTKY